MHYDLIFCDDIRLEASGQHTLVGVYQEGVNAEEFPVIGKFSCWLRIHGLSKGKHKIDFSLSFPAPDGSPSGYEIEFEIIDGNLPSAVALGPLYVKVSEAKPIEAILIIDDNDPITIGKLGVSLAAQPQT